MRRHIHRVAVVLVALMALSGAWLTWLVTDAASRYRDDPRNVRAQAGAFLPGAGRILTSDGVVVAEDDDLRNRRYPVGVVYAHLLGYATSDDRRGIEDSRYAALRRRHTGSISDWLLGLGSGRQPHDVVLTVVDPVQQAAHRAIGGATGAVVVIDIATGAVLAYVSSPTYDPNRVVAGSLDPGDADGESVDALIDRAADRVLPPGSTFKVIVAAAALEAGSSPDSEFADADEYLAPGSGSPIRNAGDGFCGDGETVTLEQALVVSCNTVFARMAVTLGAGSIASAAQRAGFDRYLPWETGAARSSITSADMLSSDPGALAQTGIGERDVRVTPLLMALIAAAVGNDGVAMRPYVVANIATASGESVSSAHPAALARMFDAAVAADLLAMMEAVVAGGTGTAARVDGLTVAGKTGTAEGSGGPHAWFIGVAGAEHPEIAIAVVVEGAGSGGRVAAPIAAAVITAWRDGA
ncbi:MAG: penicillin-binding protein 2 [Acidimicrobiia bacterium]|nr:penicillin-binding protein 2 [Acidimicrobiia bacterium]